MIYVILFLQADLLFNVLACESDAFSTFRKLLVVELVPAVLQLSKNLGPSPRLITLLNQCIEYYSIVPDPALAGRSEDFLELNSKRFEQFGYNIHSTKIKIFLY